MQKRQAELDPCEVRLRGKAPSGEQLLMLPSLVAFAHLPPDYGILQTKISLKGTVRKAGSS